jgi:guanylate kinase
MRFPNEMDAIKSRKGITIRVNRDNGTRAIDLNPHASETALDGHEFDYVIENDGSLEDLVQKVKEILIQENIL